MESTEETERAGARFILAPISRSSSWRTLAFQVLGEGVEQLLAQALAEMGGQAQVVLHVVVDGPVVLIHDSQGRTQVAPSRLQHGANAADEIAVDAVALLQTLQLDIGAQVVGGQQVIRQNDLPGDEIGRASCRKRGPNSG